MIDINYLGQLLEIFDKSSANDLRIEQDGTSIKLSKVPPRREESATHAMAPFGYPQMQMQMAPLRELPVRPVAAPSASASADTRTAPSRASRTPRGAAGPSRA